MSCKRIVLVINSNGELCYLYEKSNMLHSALCGIGYVKTLDKLIFLSDWAFKKKP